MGRGCKSYLPLPASLSYEGQTTRPIIQFLSGSENRDPEWTSKFFKDDCVYEVPGFKTIVGGAARELFTQWTRQGISKHSIE